MNEFIKIKEELERLIKISKLPMPTITEDLTKPCDFTSLKEITIKPVDDMPEEDQANHIFGHWICDFHAESDSENKDKIADIIGDLIWNSNKFQTI